MKKVIIIEDSPTFCNMLGKKLEAKGWKTILCYNYRDGLKAVRESSEWDVVITSITNFVTPSYPSPGIFNNPFKLRYFLWKPPLPSLLTKKRCNNILYAWNLSDLLKCYAVVSWSIPSQCHIHNKNPPFT